MHASLDGCSVKRRLAQAMMANHPQLLEATLAVTAEQLIQVVLASCAWLMCTSPAVVLLAAVLRRRAVNGAGLGLQAQRRALVAASAPSSAFPPDFLRLLDPSPAGRNGPTWGSGLQRSSSCMMPARLTRRGWRAVCATLSCTL